MDFQQAQRQFKVLDQQFRRGRISIEQYKAGLVSLRVSDERGYIWQIQERTGAWYVFYQGQWVPASPPTSGASPQSGGAATGPRPAAAPRPSFPWKAVGIAGGVVLLIAVLAVGAVVLLKPGLLSPTAGSQPTAGLQAGAPAGAPAAATATPESKTTFTQEAPLPATAGGSPVTDGRGVTLQVPAGAAEAPAQMTAIDAGGELLAQLEHSYKMETPFYQVSIQGQTGGIGAADLSFPAPDPSSRLLVLIDQQYAVLLDVTPQDGKLVTQAHLGPSDPGSGAPAVGGSIYYAVVTPKQASRAPTVAEVSSRSQAAPEGKTCAPPTWGSLIYFQRCESNPAGTILVAYPTRTDLTHFDADAVINSLETTTAKYPYSKLDGAHFTASAPLIAVITDAVSTPNYSVSNGVIYTPLDIITNLGTNNKDLWHEMGHLVESKTYSMYLAGNSGPKTWWLEVATENLVMLAAPAYVKGNIDSYGSATNLNSPVFIFQSSPYQWPCEGYLGTGVGQRGTCGDYYIQAQLLKVNLCASAACPLSEDNFLEALNNGAYPFNDSSAQDKVTANLQDYARYLIGMAPLNANSAIPLGGVETQNKYGQKITIAQTTKSTFNFMEEVAPPQVTVNISSTGINGRQINAALEKDGVYPLQITSGVDGQHPGLPAALIIEPGAPFYYRIDGGELKESDGSQEVTIAPIHATLGIKSVRLVAWSKNGGESFKARIEPVDLKGAWIIVPGKQLSSDVQCSGSSQDSGAHPESMGQLGATYFGLLSAMGDMQPDASGLSLDWNLVAARLPAGVTQDQVQFQSTALIGPDDIKVQGELDIPKPATSQRQPLPMDPTGLAVAALLPAAWLRRLGRGKKGRWLALGVAFVLLALVLTGCFGFAMYGSFGADLKLTGLEYKGGKGAGTYTVGKSIDGAPIWTFTRGTGTYPVNLNIEVSTEDDQGNTTTTVQTCTGTAVFELTGSIFEDLNIIIPKSDSGN